MTRCSACGAEADGDGIPPCRHFRHNRAIGFRGMALGPVEAWFFKRGLRPPFMPRDAAAAAGRLDKRTSS